jgi:hypothetical protein
MEERAARWPRSRLLVSNLGGTGPLKQGTFSMTQLDTAMGSLELPFKALKSAGMRFSSHACRAATPTRSEAAVTVRAKLNDQSAIASDHLEQVNCSQEIPLIRFHFSLLNNGGAPIYHLLLRGPPSFVLD